MLVPRFTTRVHVSSGTFRNFDLCPLKIQNGQILAYCINKYRKVHQNEKGYSHFQVRLSLLLKKKKTTKDYALCVEMLYMQCLLHVPVTKKRG